MKNVSLAPCRPVFSIGKTLIIILLATLAFRAAASDYIFVVDTSLSMMDRVSTRDKSVRITVVQTALRKFFQVLPLESRVCLISFSSGIRSEEEIVLGTEADRRKVMDWIDRLEKEAAKGGGTYLCSTLRYALERARGYAAAHKGEPVLFWALTDGGDNENGADEKDTPRRINDILNQFPDIDRDTVQFSLTLLGDVSFSITSAKPWARINKDVGFVNLVPPLIDIAPAAPKVGETVTFLDNSPSVFIGYEWKVDGRPLGQGKTAKASSLAEGSHLVELVATTGVGNALRATKKFVVLPPDQQPKLTADFVTVPGSPEPGEPVKLIGRTTGNPTRFLWKTGGNPIPGATHRDAETTFARPGDYQISFEVADDKGATAERQATVHVAAPVISLKVWADPSQSFSGQPFRASAVATGGAIMDVKWDFGDGSSATGAEVTHTYAKPGSYPIALTAATRMGAAVKAEPYTYQVIAQPLKPKADFKMTQDSVRQGARIGFANNSSGSIDRVLWKFGDEGTSDLTSPEFAFSTPGSKRIVLEVTGPAGADRAEKTVTITAPDKEIRVNWLPTDSKDPQPTAPAVVDFGRMHTTHVKNDQYTRPSFSMFDIIMPPDLPAGGAVAVQLTETLPSTLEVAHVSPETGALSPIGASITKSGRYHIHVRADAPEGEVAGLLKLVPQGDQVILGGSPAGASIPVKLAIGGSGAGFPIFLVVIGLGLGGLIVYKYLNRPPFPPGQGVEVTLQEVKPGPQGKASGEMIGTSRVFPLAPNQKVYFGRVSASVATEQLFDLGAPRAMLTRQAKGLVLNDGTGKSIVYKRGGDLLITNDRGEKKCLRMAARLLPATKSGAAKSGK